jgi:Ser/Thr protein kinase RdoA (MazF antagonist)
VAPDPGLINRTYLVGGREVGPPTPADPPLAILQWVNPIFDPRIHHDIDALTRHLAGSGLLTPRLIPTAGGRLWVDDVSGVWRMLTYIDGVTEARLESPGQAAEAGALIGRFHAAVADWDHVFQSPRREIHDTVQRMKELRASLDGCDGHALAAQTRDVGGAILDAWQAWDGEIDLPERVCHGDLKISNVRFDTSGQRAICMIDLDTLEPMPFACEMGDAWRSWCNPTTEDAPDETRFDIEIFRAAARSWLHNAPRLTDAEHRSLVPGLERICLELAGRFAADAVNNSYFREDLARHPVKGSHNLLRAHSQLNLARAVHAQRLACEEIVAAFHT